MGDFFRRIHYLLNRRRLQRELQNDIDVHREMMSAENRRDFGNPSLLRERSHEAWGWSWLDRRPDHQITGSPDHPISD